MISTAELKRIASTNGIALSVVEKDYALTWILYALAETKFKEYFIFKGGTALRKIYFSDWRYSEDLDFTLTKSLNENELIDFIKSINTYLVEKIGMNISIKSLHINPEYAQIKIQFVGPINKNTIKLDISFNELILNSINKAIISVYSDKENHFINVYSLEEILAEKIRSILQRGKSRDYYDIWRILKLHNNLINRKIIQELIIKKCQFKNIEFDTKQLFSKDRVDKVEDHWDKGLAHQINNLPEFKIVINECKALLEKFLSKELK